MEGLLLFAATFGPSMELVGGYWPDRTDTISNKTNIIIIFLLMVNIFKI
jgi:hypothetical protein